MSPPPPSLTLTALPNTDIWRKPPAHNAFNAPTLPLSPKHPLTSFRFARLTLLLPPPGSLTKFDQAGLLLHLTPVNCPAKPTINDTKWLKTGVEMYRGAPYVSTVGCDRWSDWSITPLAGIAESKEGEGIEATVEVRREDGVLWVYAIEGATETPLREVAWFFEGEEDWEVQVSAMAARPSTGVEGGLEAGFRNLKVVFE